MSGDLTSAGFDSSTFFSDWSALESETLAEVLYRLLDLIPGTAALSGEVTDSEIHGEKNCNIQSIVFLSDSYSGVSLCDHLRIKTTSYLHV